MYYPSCCIWAKYTFDLFRIRNWDLTQFSEKDSRILPGLSHMVFRVNSRKLDTSSCRRWGHEGWWYYLTMAEVRRWGHEASRYYPTMAREGRSGPMGYPFRPDEDVRNLSGGVCNTLVPHRVDWDILFSL